MNTLFIVLGILILVGIYFYIQSGDKKSSVKEIPTFIEADKFSGSKEGYVFKMDSQGLGYYLDKHKV
tara:strand:+ start:880 stop:1080 length:201 start_codon:yes stop_codon:yes gene_type:complete